MQSLPEVKKCSNNQSSTYQQLDSFKYLTQEPRILRIKQVLSIYPVGRSTLYKMIADGKFSRPVSLGGKSVGWRSQDLFDFIAGLESKQ
jgi:prophage regulatory protein